MSPVTNNMERPTRFLARHPESSGRFSEIHIVDRHPIEVGSENKERIIGKISTPTNERNVYLIRRNFDDRFPHNTPYNRVIADQTKESWVKYKALNQPTYNTLRIAQDGSLLVTDLCADGSRIYGNPDFWKNLKENKILRNKKDEAIDKLFVSIIASDQVVLIYEKAKEIVDNASKNRIGLPLHDPFELIVHPDGSWDIETVDVAETFFKDNIYETELFNNNCTEYFIAYLKRTSDELKIYQQKGFFQKVMPYILNKIKKLQKDLWLKIRYF